MLLFLSFFSSVSRAVDWSSREAIHRSLVQFRLTYFSFVIKIPIVLSCIFLWTGFKIKIKSYWILVLNIRWTERAWQCFTIQSWINSKHIESESIQNKNIWILNLNQFKLQKMNQIHKNALLLNVFQDFYLLFSFFD